MSKPNLLIGAAPTATRMRSLTPTPMRLRCSRGGARCAPASARGDVMAREVCPHCHQTLRVSRLGVSLSPLKARILDLITRAGPDGIAGDDLFRLVFEDRRGWRSKPIRRTTLKSHIWQINDALDGTGHRIMVRHDFCYDGLGSKSIYRMMRTGRSPKNGKLLLGMARA